MRTHCFFYIIFLLGLQLPTHAETDAGKEPVGTLLTGLIFATNGDVSLAGNSTKQPSPATISQLQKTKHLKFSHYRALGSDKQKILRGYENWATPLRPSEEILLSFEPEGRLTENSMRLDLELWQRGKKILKANPKLSTNKPLYILGPHWRKGRIIISVQLIALK